MQGGGGGSGEAAGRRQADLGVSSFLTSIRAAGLGSLVAWGAGLINNEFTPHINHPPPAACKVTPPSSQLPPLSKLSNPSSETSLTQSPWGKCERVDKAEASLAIADQPRLIRTLVCLESTQEEKE